MKKQHQALILSVAVIIMASGVILGLNYKNNQGAQREQEIATYLQQFKPTIPEGATYVEADSLFPDRATTSNVEKFSSLIVRGQVVAIGDPYQDEHGITNHRVSLRVSSVLKGDSKQAEQILEIEVLGGTIDNVVSWSPESPTFTDGEEAIVFLAKGERYYYLPFQAFGKVTINGDTVTGIDENLGVFQKSLSTYENELNDYITK